ncbi:MAG: rhomboid family intramembrane serine protease [Ruminococcaceae bacterium]|nr:rhomboid family intramembrane serine protease [Oscillospiraceae bacterium]
MKKKSPLIQYNAPTTLNFALLSFAVLVIGIATRNASTMKFFCVFRSPLNDFLTYPRFFTHVLGHSSFAHYSGNITLMLVLGPTLEERYGSQTLFYTMLITAFISGLLQWLLFPGSALLGASGIVFMMILMASLGGMRSGGIPLTLILVFIIYIGGEIYNGLTSADNVSQLTHIIGGICGAVMGIGLRKPGGKKPRSGAHRSVS